MPYLGLKPLDRAITSTDLEDGAVLTADIADGAITTAKLDDAAVTAAKVAAAGLGANTFTAKGVGTAAIADAAESKQGKFLPGCHIPIITPKEFYEKKCESVLVLPWNLISELKIKLSGKKIVTAIPEIKQWS